jgi:hypothetical protein
MASAALLPRLRGRAGRGALRQESGYFCAEPSDPGRPEPPPGREGPLVSTPNGHHMATAAGPRHCGGTTGRVRVRTGTLAPCRRSAARVHGDRGPGYGRRLKRIAKR